MSDMRIPARPIGHYPWYLRPFFWSQRRRYGAVLDAALMWGRVPPLFMAVALLYGALDRRRSPIAPALRSLITVRVSQINHCAFCVDINTATLVRRGVPQARIEALAGWRDSELFDEAERAALDFAEAMTHSHIDVDDTLMNELRRHYEEDVVVELAGLIAFQNLSSKFNSALAVPPQGFCQIPSLQGRPVDLDANAKTELT